ncbi:MAG: RNA 2',3'-cyclic phosphodiesterase [Bacillota bacterium]|nr:RNA 2',3'-cyclic phosphodiesterase [Bacillota bacterium]
MYEGVHILITFIAVELEENIKNRVWAYTENVLKPCCEGGRWVRKDNYHITLKYLGDTKEKDLAAVFKALKLVARNKEGFVLYTGSPGTFGMQKGLTARVLWLGVSGNVEKLKSIKDEIEEEMAGLGFGVDRRFSPHITLSRDVKFTGDIEAVPPLPSLGISVRAISLMESRVEGGKRLYIPLAVYKLDNSQGAAHKQR